MSVSTFFSLLDLHWTIASGQQKKNVQRNFKKKLRPCALMKFTRVQMVLVVPEIHLRDEK